MADPAYIVDGVLTDGEAWVGIATTTLGSDTATVTFTSPDDGQGGDFPQYMDLVLVIYARTAGAGSTDREMNMQLNNDTGTNYNAQKLRSYGTGVTAGATSGAVSFNIGQNPSTNATPTLLDTTTTTLFAINAHKANADA